MILMEPLLLILALWGAIISFRKDKFLWKFFGLYILFYYLVLGPLLGGVVERRLLPIIPALAAFAALFIDFLPKRISYILLFVFLINPLLFDTALLKKGSIIEAREWINKNIPANSLILDKCWLELNENKEVLEEIAQNYPSFLTTKRKYLLNNPILLDKRKITVYYH